jgi:hypothetical protein
MRERPMYSGCAFLRMAIQDYRPAMEQEEP